MVDGVLVRPTRALLCWAGSSRDPESLHATTICQCQLFASAPMMPSASILLLICASDAVAVSTAASASTGIPTEWLQEYEDASRALGFGTHSWLPGPPAGNTGPYVTNAALPSIGNGFIGTQWLSPVLYISGLFSGSPSTASQPGGTAVHRAAVPSSASVSICDAVSIATALDFRYATVEQRVTPRAHPGVEVMHRAYAHRTRKDLLVVEFNVSGASASPSVELCDQAFEAMTQGKVPPGWSSPPEPDLTVAVSVSSQLPGAEVITAQLVHGDAETSNLTRVAICRDVVPRNISTGVTQLLASHVVGDNSSVASDLVAQACGLLAEARQDAMSGKLLASHRLAWEALWANGVQIGGSPALARMVNSTHYGYLVALRDDVDYSTGPGGLSTNGYNGHVFWDMDTWIFPGLNLFHPQLGDSHLRFRTRGMVGAAALALQHNQSGLMYPWEATPNGYTANNGGMAGSEPHVTGDVAVAFWNRWRATHDLHFLRTAAWPVIAGVADFWAHRLTCPPDTSQPCWIKCVSGPDEFHFCKDREVFTTALASPVFQIAVKTVKLLQIEGRAEQVKLWQSIEQRLSLDLMAPPQGKPLDHNITKCYDGYAGEAVMQPSVADVGYPLMWGGPGRAGEPLNQTQREIDLDFYWRRTSGFIAGMVWPSVSVRARARARVCVSE